MYSTNTIRLNTYLDLDFYRLSKLEELREGEDLKFIISGNFCVSLEQTQSSGKDVKSLSLGVRITKSQWVEEILGKVGFKDVSLLEIPKLPKGEYEEVINWVDSAWRQYMMGEYDKVLVDCRKALEGMTAIVRKRGFEKIIEREGKRETIPDWEKLFDHKDMGDIFGTIFPKLYFLTTLATHYGKSINREDADLALMMTHSIVNYIIKRTS
jgi:hypothetical protein